MENLDSLKKDLKSTKDLKVIVSTMKTLAATNIKKYEKTANNLVKYLEILDLGFQAILQKKPEFLEYLEVFENQYSSKNIDKQNVCIVIGSNQGLCGRFNDRVSEFFISDIENSNKNYIITIGERLDTIVRAKKVEVKHKFLLSNSVETINDLVYEIILIVEKLLNEKELNKVFMYYTKYDSRSNGILIKKRLLPLEKKYFENLKNRVWPTNNIPLWKIETKDLFFDFLRQYLFSNIFLMIATSMAAEQKNRLLTLQSAEENIKEHINDLTLKFNQIRQTLITSNLIDVVSGFKSIKKLKKDI